MSRNIDSNCEPAERRFTLFYDGDCLMCCSAVQLLERLALLQQVQALAWDQNASDDPDIKKKIQGEMVLLDKADNTCQTGVDALVQLLRIHNRLPLLSGAFHLPGVRQIAQLVYKTVSLNRRILSPNGKMTCACEPPFNWPFRLLFCVSLLLIAIIGNLGFGMSLANFYSEHSMFSSGTKFLMVVGGGWVLNGIVLLPFLKKRYLTFILQSCVVITIGSLVLMPFSMALWLGMMNGITLEILSPVAIMGTVLSFAMMFESLKRRVKILGFPRWLPWIWLLVFVCVSVPFLIYLKLLGISV